MYEDHILLVPRVVFIHKLHCTMHKAFDAPSHYRTHHEYGQNYLIESVSLRRGT